MDQILFSRMEDIVPKHQDLHPPYEYYKHAVKDVAGLCAVSFYRIPSQKASYPFHYHTQNAEVFYVISGAGTAITPEGDKKIRPGDIIVCPPGSRGAHKIVNTSRTEDLVYLDVDTAFRPDIVRYPDSAKTGILQAGQRSLFFRDDAEAAYYDGE